MKKCKEIMTKDVVSCLPDQTIDQVAELMKSENIGPVPVVEANKRLIGIVTDRDIVVKVVAAHLDGRATRVREILTPDPVTCGPEDSVEEAMDKLEDDMIAQAERSDNPVGYIVRLKAGRPAKYIERQATLNLTADLTQLPTEDARAVLRAMLGATTPATQQMLESSRDHQDAPSPAPLGQDRRSERGGQFQPKTLYAGQT